MIEAFNVADEIKALDVNDPQWRDKVACIVKKFGHSQKLSAYYRMHFFIARHYSRKPRLFKKGVKRFFDDFVKLKIKTHDEFSKRDYKRQIYGLFDWKK